jgi:hypothetical protein
MWDSEYAALHEYVLSSANSIHVPEPAHDEKISTPRYCVGSSSSFRADVGLGAFVCMHGMVEALQGESKRHHERAFCRPCKSPCSGLLTPVLNDSMFQMISSSTRELHKYYYYLDMRYLRPSGYVTASRVCHDHSFARPFWQILGWLYWDFPSVRAMKDCE